MGKGEGRSEGGTTLGVSVEPEVRSTGLRIEGGRRLRTAGAERR